MAIIRTAKTVKTEINATSARIAGRRQAEPVTPAADCGTRYTSSRSGELRASLYDQNIAVPVQLTPTATVLTAMTEFPALLASFREWPAQN